MATVRYIPIDGEQVSAEWFTLLRDLRAAGVDFTVREGKRTMARQAYFWAGSPSNKRRTWLGNLAAFPSPRAPHIRVGRIDHAIDFRNAAGVIAGARTRGVTITLPVRNEDWHGEAIPAELIRYHVRHGGPLTIRKGAKRSREIQRLQVLLRRLEYLPAKWRAHKAYTVTVRRAVRAFQKDRGMKADGVVGPQTWKALREGPDRPEAKPAVKSKPPTPKRKEPTRMSARGRKLLIREEGVVPYAYDDPDDNATFGVGHLIHLGPVTDKDRAAWGTRAHPMTLAYVEKTLERDLKRYEGAVAKAVTVPLEQHEFDACVSLAFNIGTAGFATSTVVRKLNAKDRKGAAEAFMMWVKPAILKPRRARERRLFLEGKYE